MEQSQADRRGGADGQYGGGAEDEQQAAQPQPQHTTHDLGPATQGALPARPLPSDNDAPRHADPQARALRPPAVPRVRGRRNP